MEKVAYYISMLHWLPRSHCVKTRNVCKTLKLTFHFAVYSMTSACQTSSQSVQKVYAQAGRVQYHRLIIWDKKNSIYQQAWWCGLI